MTIYKSVLDHGFVKLRNLAGPTPRRDMRNEIMRPFDADDRDPAQAARMSFDQMDGDRTAEEDFKLCRYLMKNWHTSPFEMVECWIEMKLPIFVARQFVRHRTVSINEVSGRYVTLPAEWYIPEIVGGTEKPVFTIFITGPTLRRWGFHHTERWVDAYDWDDFCRERGLNTTKMDGYAEQLKGPTNAA